VYHLEIITIQLLVKNTFKIKLIGVCCGLNKLGGLFTPDDERMFKILAKQASIMLRNSMQFDQSVLLQYRLKQMLSVEILHYMNTIRLG